MKYFSFYYVSDGTVLCVSTVGEVGAVDRSGQ